jgi:adenylate cyclase
VATRFLVDMNLSALIDHQDDTDAWSGYFAGPSGGGEAMAEAVERKLTTIMCADVSGYSRLMEADEAATLATLKVYREAMTGLMARHRGRLVSTAGDSLLVEFSSVVEAVQCAVEIQRELASRNRSVPDARRMDFRIGINLGDVMVEAGDLYGEGVNIAARLESLAEPGGICISRTVYDQVRSKLTVGYDFMGDQSMKNMSERVPVFRVQLDGSAKRDRPEPAPPRPVAPDQVKRIRNWRQRAARAGFVVAILFVINLLTSFGDWWFVWPALIIGAFVAWGALRAYYPDLVGADDDDDHRRESIQGDVTFSRDTKFRGKIGGDVVVKRGVHLTLRGKIGGHLTIEPDAIAEVRGKIGGDVINRGGKLKLVGKLAGEVREEADPDHPAS